MSKKVEIVLNSSGVRSLLRSSEMCDMIQKRANTALSLLGDGYSSSAYTGRNRVNVQISADSITAKRENLENNSLLKSLGGL